MKFKFHIDGMHCTSCIDKIKSALSPHFKVIDVTLNPPLLQIEADQMPSTTDLNAYASTVGKYTFTSVSDAPSHTEDQKGLMTYYPIFLIATYIIGVATINSFQMGSINWMEWMRQFMAGFFLVFSAFKLLDIKGFAEGYATYDLLAKHWYTYGYLYPFIELGLGILYLTNSFPIFTNAMTVIIMGFSSIGVINSLLKKQTFQCACLGTLLKVPLSSITLVEDLTMVVMAGMSLVMM